MLADLLKPFAFLGIRHPTRAPIFVCWVLPFFVSILFSLAALALGLNVDVFGANGMISRVLGFVQNLPGFYVAALAAIATFSNEDMNKYMPGVPPTMKVLHNGKPTTVGLTRRRFLSSMFAYLTALCICLTLASIAALAVADPLKQLLAVNTYLPIKVLFSLIFLTFLLQMICVTMWGLFYLGERIHTPD
jgi:hypothetical protein